MIKRTVFRPRFLWIGIASVMSAVTLAIGCTSAPSTTSCASGDVLACTCSTGRPGTSVCGNPVCNCDEDAGALATVDGGNPDGPQVDTPGDATHLDEKPPPTTTYGECAVKGSFGWPCTAATSGPDPTECTDPTFPECFVGGQGAWCTASCMEFGTCPGGDADGGDAGCVPVGCNARGYCK